ncbi:MAG: TerB family tellurite resistance protein [Flavobacteriales bacterium]|nr:TerB family tellurite resistance protein [Flavobacteriales bacterium]
MQDKEQLYETLGELLFVVAMADGVIQHTERESLNKLLKDHPWAHEIKWSFDYEVSHHAKLEEVYTKVIDFCHHYGPAAEYYEFIDAMKVIADAAEGVNKDEDEIITSFSKDLTERFMKDIEKQLALERQ